MPVTILASLSAGDQSNRRGHEIVYVQTKPQHRTPGAQIVPCYELQ